VQPAAPVKILIQISKTDGEQTPLTSREQKVELRVIPSVEGFGGSSFAEAIERGWKKEKIEKKWNNSLKKCQPLVCRECCRKHYNVWLCI
jgi:hypothetical protein